MISPEEFFKNKEKEESVLSVSGFTDKVKSTLENEFGTILVRGEISNLTEHSSGHMYFSLKDEESQVQCVMFRYAAATLKFKPAHGDKVVVSATISVYKPRGNYQLVVTRMYQDGLGDLHKRFLLLKEKLKEEGLFNQKRALPKYPKKIGLITSQTGAVIRDLLTNLLRRAPYLHIILAPAKVQGVGSKEDLIAAIGKLHKQQVDLIIIGRGGGSLEDLWSFNEEELARAIYYSTIPTISAVGHETDFTISDFVADARAATPSTAAELAVQDTQEILAQIAHYKKQLLRIANNQIDYNKEKLQQLKNRPVLAKPEGLTQMKMQKLDMVSSQLLHKTQSLMQKYKEQFRIVTTRLSGINPRTIMNRGYSFLESKGKAVRSIDAVNVEDIVTITVQDGKINAKIKEKKHGI